MTEKVKILTPKNLVEIFGGTPDFHKRMLKTATKYGLSGQYIHKGFEGDFVLYESELDEYKKLLTRTVSLTKNNPLRSSFYSTQDLSELFGNSSVQFYIKTLKELYNKIESEIPCGLNNGDIIMSYLRGKNSETNYTYLLKKDALKKYAEIIQKPINNEYKWLGYSDLRKLGLSQTKISQALDWAHKQVQSGNDIGLSLDDIKISHAGRKSISGRAYNIKSTALDAFITATGLKTKSNTKMSKSHKGHETNKSTRFKSASQRVVDAWGEEWTTTYSRMPRDNNDR